VDWYPVGVIAMEALRGGDGIAISAEEIAPLTYPQRLARLKTIVCAKKWTEEEKRNVRAFITRVFAVANEEVDEVSRWPCCEQLCKLDMVNAR